MSENFVQMKKNKLKNSFLHVLHALHGCLKKYSKITPETYQQSLRKNTIAELFEKTNRINSPHRYQHTFQQRWWIEYLEIF